METVGRWRLRGLLAVGLGSGSQPGASLGVGNHSPRANSMGFARQSIEDLNTGITHEAFTHIQELDYY